MVTKTTVNSRRAAPKRVQIMLMMLSKTRKPRREVPDVEMNQMVKFLRKTFEWWSYGEDDYAKDKRAMTRVSRRVPWGGQPDDGLVKDGYLGGKWWCYGVDVDAKKSEDKTKKKKMTLTGRWNGWNGVLMIWVVVVLMMILKKSEDKTKKRKRALGRWRAVLGRQEDRQVRVIYCTQPHISLPVI